MMTRTTEPGPVTARDGAGEKIAFFIQDLRAGGAERNVTRIMNGIVARGFETELVVVNRTGAFFSELDDRISVIELPQARTLTSIVGLGQYILQRRPAALVASLTHTNIAAIIANVATRRRTKLVVVERNHFSTSVKGRRGLVRLAYAAAPLLYPRADAVAAVSAGVRDDLATCIGVPPDSIDVLYNPVVSKEVSLLAEEPVADPWFSDGVPVVLGVGRLERQKNFALLIKAFGLVRRGRAARLAILGQGELQPELERLVDALGLRDSVKLLGFDSNPFRYMRRAAVFVLSSDWEGLPTALIEAMACGAPVVSTDCPSGPREILRGGRVGRLVPTGDADALARAIDATLDEPGDASARIARANEFSLDAAVDRYLDVLARIGAITPPIQQAT
jgi:glycosyltransferase involved in cell wall biosynthesis